jgi:hypothetical membrane protein
MKLFYCLIISLFISNVLQGQSFQTDERAWNSATQRAFSDLGRTKLTKPVLGSIEKIINVDLTSLIKIVEFYENNSSI